MIALGAIGGGLIGVMLRQATIGVIVGVGIGVLLALAIFAIDRR